MAFHSMQKYNRFTCFLKIPNVHNKFFFSWMCASSFHWCFLIFMQLIYYKICIKIRRLLDVYFFCCLYLLHQIDKSIFHCGDELLKTYSFSLPFVYTLCLLCSVCDAVWFQYINVFTRLVMFNKDALFHPLSVFTERINVFANLFVVSFLFLPITSIC